MLKQSFFPQAQPRFKKCIIGNNNNSVMNHTDRENGDQLQGEIRQCDGAADYIKPEMAYELAGT